MKIIDTHVHFWDQANLTYDWVNGIPKLQGAFLPEDYKQANGNHEVVGIVFVEAGAASDQNIDEVHWIESLDAPIKGIVAHAPLENPDGREATLETLASRPLVRGIRRNYQSEAVGFAENPDFIAGIKSLQQHNLSFDICIKSHQLNETIELVRQFPDAMLILDHIAKPDIANGEFDTWATQLKSLASFDNITCKISGVITEADHQNWTQEQIKPYIHATIDAFGIDRVMFGSDWPVVKLAGSFTSWMDTLTNAVQDLNEAEKEKLFTSNAIKAYRLDM